MSSRKVIALLAIWAIGSTSIAQTILHQTNTVGMSFANHTLSGVSGSFRLNIRVMEYGDVTLDMSDITSFPLTIKDRADGRIINTVSADTSGDENDASVGQRRWVINNLNVGEYELKAVAVPASGTDDQYNIHWGYLSVTSALSASSTVSLSLVPLSDDSGTIGTAERRWSSVNAVDGVFSNLTIGGVLDVSGAITAVDTSAVKLAGSVMQANQDYAGLYAPTNVYDGSYTGIVATKQYVDSVVTDTDTTNAISIGVAFTPTNYTGAGNVEGDLIALDSAIGDLGGSSSPLNTTTNQGIFQITDTTNNVGGTAKLGLILGAEGASITANGIANTIIGARGSGSPPYIDGNGGNSLIMATYGHAYISSGGSGQIIMGGRHDGQITSSGSGNGILGGDNYAGGRPTISGTGAGSFIIGGGKVGSSTISGSGEGLIVVNAGSSTITAGGANLILGGNDTDIVGGSGYNSSINAVVADFNGTFLSFAMNGYYPELNASKAGIIGGHSIEANATNSLSLFGIGWTNNIPNAISFGEVTAHRMEGAIPIGYPDFVIEAWVNYGSSNVKYAVSTINTVTVQVIE